MTSPTLQDLRDNPRPISAREAARMLSIREDQLIALDLQATGEAADGEAVYESNEIVHWLGVQQENPALFESRIADYPNHPG